VPLDILASTVTFKPGLTMLDGDVAGHSLRNVRANLAAIAAAINADPKRGWNARVLTNGVRLMLTPISKLGPSSLIDGSSFAAGGPAGFADAGAIFGGVLSIPGAGALEGGLDGD